MADTEQLIASLSSEAKNTRALSGPGHMALRLIAVLVAYGIAATFFIEIRSDLITQLTRPAYALECLLLAAVTLSSVMAAIYSMYPDAYQRSAWLKLPYALFAAFVVFIVVQIPMIPDARMVIPVGAETHAMECTICIGLLSLLPSAMIFTLLRRGASVRPFQSGVLAVLASTGLGCLALRFAEANDSVQHLILWHYLPTLLFAALGALLGKWLLEW